MKKICNRFSWTGSPDPAMLVYLIREKNFVILFA